MTTQIRSSLSTRDREFLRTFLPDEEGAPWMAIADRHRLAVTALVQPLSWHRDADHPEWYVASEMAVYFPVEGGKNFVAPDVFVTLAPNHPRTSFDTEAEGGFPLFVLEVVSEESLGRDTGTVEGKVRLYDLLGAEEYVIFDPEPRMSPRLQGYRRGAGDAWLPWAAGSRGELHSTVLGLTLIIDGHLLRLEDEHGHRLRTADEERARAEQAIEDLEQERARMERARVGFEQERARADTLEARIQMLEAQVARLVGGGPGNTPPED